MKVIVAGLPKTGTKSMNEALKLLGYEVIYDYPENNYFLMREWTEIVSKGGTKEDFRKMFEGVDVCMDIPCCHYWEEIHQAFPDVKVRYSWYFSSNDIL